LGTRRATCELLTTIANSVSNGWRMEDAWLDN